MQGRLIKISKSSLSKGQKILWKHKSMCSEISLRKRQLLLCRRSYFFYRGDVFLNFRNVKRCYPGHPHLGQEITLQIVVMIGTDCIGMMIHVVVTDLPDKS